MGFQDFGRDLENAMSQLLTINPPSPPGSTGIPELIIANGLQREATQDALTALAGGGQTGATAITNQNVRFTTVATIGDSAVLPAALAGRVVTVGNDGAAAMDVFPATGDLIRPLAANTAVRINSGSVVGFYCTVAGKWTAIMPPLPAAQFVTGTTTTTFAAGQLTGAAVVNYTNTQATPGSIATRTATQMFNDMGNVLPGQSYLLIVTNGQGTGTLTITAGTGVTLTGTMTIAANTWRGFIVTFNTATTLTIQNIAVGTFS